MRITEKIGADLCRLEPLYGERESLAMLKILYETAMREPWLNIRSGLKEPTNEECDKVQAWMERLLQGEPLQYITGRSDFMGLSLSVEPSVLIPRPETEELVHFILEENHRDALRVLDIGTGSGCIALGLKKYRPSWQVYACDISSPALEVAHGNATYCDLDIRFFQLNILKSDPDIKDLDIVVSNPPYIPDSEKSRVQKNVLQYEPGEALFVKNDPLIFYKRIWEACAPITSKEARFYFEVHEDKAGEVADVLNKAGAREIVIRKDIQGKERMLRAVRHA